MIDTQSSSRLVDAPIKDRIGDVEFIRGDRGEWLYAGTTIQVPGATDRRLEDLADGLKPRLIGYPGETPDAAVITAAAIDAHPEALEWCRTLGAPMTLPDTDAPGGEARVYMVPFAEWKRRAERPLGISAPEFSDDPYEAAYALAERKLRERLAEVDQLTEQRLDAMKDAIEHGMTRTRAAQIAGLTTSRVTQLLKLPAPVTTQEMNLLALVRIEPTTSSSLFAKAKATPGVSGKRETFNKHLANLVKRGLVDWDGQSYSITPAGLHADGSSPLKTPRPSITGVSDETALEESSNKASHPADSAASAPAVIAESE